MSANDNTISDSYAQRGTDNYTSAVELANQLAIPFDSFRYFVLLLEILNNHPNMLDLVNRWILQDGGIPVVIPAEIRNWVQQRSNINPADLSPLLPYDQTMHELWTWSVTNTNNNADNTVGNASATATSVTAWNNSSSPQHSQAQTTAAQSATVPTITPMQAAYNKWLLQNKENLDPRDD